VDKVEPFATNERRRLAAIVAADLAEFSRLMGADESGTLAALRTRRAEVVDPAVAAHGGRIVKTIGDGLLLEFQSVVEAVQCALDVQEGMAQLARGVPADRQLAYRIGVHLGDVIVEGDDLFGEGINIAARLQTLAEPGGICLSQRAWEEVRDRLPYTFADGGERTLKNIARPVRVWHWPAVPAAPAPAAVPALALPDKPSIAVLPFDNMSGDPEQEYFADGIAEDLITELSRFRELFVIARNSTFVFKGKAVDVQEVGGRLGVRYVVEGSVRRTLTRVRVNAQLVEAATGRHVWAERYDRDLADIFAAQDDITLSIVSAIAPALGELERARARRAPCCNTSAWDAYQRGLWHIYRYSPKDHALARELFGHAIRIDPQFAPGHAGLAYVLFNEVVWGYVADVAGNLERARRAATRALALDPRDAFAHVVLGRVLTMGGDVEGALAECQRALELNPNLAVAHHGLAYALALAGRADDALASVDRAIRLSPYDALMHAFVSLRSGILVILGRHAEAIEAAHLAQRQPGHTAWALLHEASALANLGQLEAARAAIERARAMQPEVSMRWLRSLLRTAPGANTGAYFDGMRLAGLPE
jgi:adenylate cyclase